MPITGPAVTQPNERFASGGRPLCLTNAYRLPRPS